MRDLRLRFGFVLALALLPLLVFSIWKSIYDYQAFRQQQNATLRLTVQQSAAEIVSTLDRAEAVLKIIDGADIETNCRDIVTLIVKRFSTFEQVHVIHPDGRHICTTDQQLQSPVTRLRTDMLSVENPLVILKRDQVGTGDGSQYRLRIMYGSFKDDKLHRVLTAELKPFSLTTADSPVLEEFAVSVAVMNEEGELLTGTQMSLQGNRKDWVEKASRDGQLVSSYKNAQGVLRDIVIMPTRNENLFIAASQRADRLFQWNYVNPFSSAVLPLLAWIFGFGAIWLATDQLILVHLRHMRESLLMFARGDTRRRVGNLKNPPHSIRELARSMDIMADRITSREEELADLISEKDILLREIHHRVKNNLQIIISLLNMQERKLEDESAVFAIQETRQRINAISLVHRGLYESQDFRYIPMESFIERLLSELSIAFSAESRNIIIESQTDCVPLEADTAIPIALFIVEAVTNAVKHGVPDGGHVNVNISQSGERITVIVADTGPGFDSEVSQSGTGMRLIKGFARQLSAELDFQTKDGGHALIMSFTHRPYPNRI